MKYILSKEWLRNLCLWAIILPLLALTDSQKLTCRETVIGVGFFTAMYIACWFNNRCIALYLMPRKQPWLYFAILVPLIGLMVLNEYASSLMMASLADSPWSLGNSILSCVFFLFIGFGINAAYREVMRRQDTLEQELFAKRNELRFLQNQVNPHFLFNSLNNLYSASITEPEKISERILQMAELLRYQLSSAKREFVPLDEERGFLLNYLDVEKRRLGRQLELSVETSGDFSQRQIAPLLFFPFLENALKYSTGAIDPAAVFFRLESGTGSVRFFVKNSLPETAAPHPPSTGIGIGNVQKRLELLYPGRYELQILPEPTSFSVDLTIKF